MTRTENDPPTETRMDGNTPYPAPLFPRATRSASALGDLAPEKFWVSWNGRQTDANRCVGEGVLNVLRAVSRMPTNIWVLIHTWTGTAPWVHEGLHASNVVEHDPGGPNHHAIVYTTSCTNGAHMPYAFVWPPRFADPTRNLWPLYAVEALGDFQARDLERVFAQMNGLPSGPVFRHPTV